MSKSHLFKLLCASSVLAALCACSNGSGSTTSTVDAAGHHPANWLTQHYVEYKAANGGSKDVSAVTPCSQCHGTDLSGGIANVGCFSATFNGVSCHANGDHTLGHPASWLDPTSGGFHGAAIRGSASPAITSACGVCHATAAGGTSVGSAPSCLSTDPKFGISCHSASPAANSTGCVSCHDNPPNGQTPVGDKAPNQAGSHAAHSNIAGVTCATCHSSFGSGTIRHATAAFLNHSTAFLKLDGAYSAKLGGFSFIGDKCSGVSCHGGQQTPVWGVTLDVATACRSCHEQGFAPQTPQFNSFYSGDFSGVNLHQFHLATTNPGAGRLIFCTDCHNTDALTQTRHFGGLATPEMTEADATVGLGSTRITAYSKNSTTGVRTCTSACHTLAPTTSTW